MNGEVKITLRAMDTYQNSTNYVLTVNVTPTNDKPTLVSVAGQPAKPTDVVRLEAYEDALMEVEVVADDIDGDTLVFSDNSRLINIESVDAETGLISFTPTNEDVGSYDFEIKIEDAKYEIELQMEITVLNTNDPPVITTSDVTTQSTSNTDNALRATFIETSSYWTSIIPSVNAINASTKPVSVSAYS